MRKTLNKAIRGLRGAKFTSQDTFEVTTVSSASREMESLHQWYNMRSNGWGIFPASGNGWILELILKQIKPQIFKHYVTLETCLANLGWMFYCFSLKQQVILSCWGTDEQASICDWTLKWFWVRLTQFRLQATPTENFNCRIFASVQDIGNLLTVLKSLYKASFPRCLKMPANQ